MTGPDVESLDQTEIATRLRLDFADEKILDLLERHGKTPAVQAAARAERERREAEPKPAASG